MESGGDEEPPRSGDPLESEEQRMSSSWSDLGQHLAAALRRQTPAAAAPAGAGGVAPDRAAAAIQRQKAAQRSRAATDAFSAKLAPARSLADQTIARREQLKGLKDQLRNLQSPLSEAVTLQSSKESKRKRATESILEATATNERLRSLVADSREKRDLRNAITSEELKALESLEAESKEDTERDENARKKALLWYDKFLGFRVIGGEGDVKFVYNKIDPQRPEKEYSFRVSPSLQFIECDPHVKDIEELAKDLDLNKHLFKFARMAREKFQSSFMNGTLPISPVVSVETLPVSPVVGSDVSAAPLPSPVMSVSNRSEDAHNQTQSSSKKNVQLLPAKREATALSGVSPGVLRRSPRLEGKR
ncbi:kinetochore protein SPC25 homolog [Miscanthus floridulus]|uniref:kinetochore protein SPC25 homolog n=1 Tax=Miscanthus floridulus TaxID=154761 RepID=UPI00345A7C7B